jgi:hypothetical protein
MEVTSSAEEENGDTNRARASFSVMQLPLAVPLRVAGATLSVLTPAEPSPLPTLLTDAARISEVAAMAIDRERAAAASASLRLLTPSLA